jgi:hypothetical protein
MSTKDSIPVPDRGSVSVMDPEKQHHDQSGDHDLVTASDKDFESVPPIDHAAERRLVRKLDL